MRNKQKKACVDFDKVATGWKDVVVTREKKIRLLEEVLNLHSESIGEIDNGMEVCTIDFSKGAVSNCPNFSEAVIYLVNKCYQKVLLNCTKTQIFSLPCILLKGRCCQSSGMFSKTAQLES